MFMMKTSGAMVPQGVILQSSIVSRAVRGSRHEIIPRVLSCPGGCMLRFSQARFTLAVVATLLGTAATAADPPKPSNHHPDFSGIWAQYVNPAGRSAGGFGSRMPQLPLTEEGRKKVDAYKALLGPDDSPGAHCVGSGMPEALVFSGAYPMEIVQRPDLLVVIYEAHTEVRHLYLGGRIIPAADRLPDRDGYSTAHWEADTLVVETASLKEQEDQMYPHSDQARIVERYHLIKDSAGSAVLVDDWTLTDPAFYTKPVSDEKKWSLDPKGILLPYDCPEEAWLDHLDALRTGKEHASASYK
jgi:hypothetical protein